MRWWVIILIIILAIVAIFFIGMTRVPDMLANNLSKKLGVPVSIDSMNFSIDEIEMKKIEIGNPKGYSLPRAFSAKKIEIEAPLTRYFKKEIVIDEVEVNDIYLGIEFDSSSGTSGNWSVIFSNFQKTANLDKESGPIILIKKIVFTNITTELLFRKNGKGPQRLPNISRIELTNISTKGGIPTDQLMSSVLGQMLKEVFIQQNLNNMLDGILKSPQNALDSFLQPFKGAFNATPAPVQQPIMCIGRRAA